jgi:glycerol-3-phosphate acyltransferase PlsX
VRIALDAMGGDRAPGVIVRGGLDAIEEAGRDLEIILVGRKETLEAEISRLGISSHPFELVDARDVIDFHDQPAVTLRKKKDSSIAVGLRLQREGKADGFVSAGNTGAVVANGLFTLGRIPGVSRPGIATFFPNQSGVGILLDVGATIDCTPEHLFQFAVMGSCYAELVLEIPNPRVGLLNVGEESSKGTEVVQETYKTLEKSGLNFTGNAEGRDILAGSVDVVVCDGFVGNVVLKFTESVIGMVYSVMRGSLTSTVRGRLGGLLLKPAFRELKARFDYAEYGGAPLLGLNGVCTIAHGSSSARAIKNAVLATTRYIRYDVRSAIEERLAKSERTAAESA